MRTLLCHATLQTCVVWFSYLFVLRIIMNYNFSSHYGFKQTFFTSYLSRAIIRAWRVRSFLQQHSQYRAIDLRWMLMLHCKCFPFTSLSKNKIVENLFNNYEVTSFVFVWIFVFILSCVLFAVLPVLPFVFVLLIC